jgi:hypothetical protein
MELNSISPVTQRITPSVTAQRSVAAAAYAAESAPAQGVGQDTVQFSSAVARVAKFVETVRSMPDSRPETVAQAKEDEVRSSFYPPPELMEALTRLFGAASHENVTK